MRYLNGANIDKETPLFRGYGNLSAFANPKDDHYFFLGVSILREGLFLSFGDYLLDDELVFIAANYRPNEDESLSHLIFLEMSCFQSWMSGSSDKDDLRVPTPEEWCLVKFSDWISHTKTKVELATVNSFFKSLREFQVGCAMFLEHCKAMKSSQNEIYGRMFLHDAEVLVEESDDNDHKESEKEQIHE